MIAVCNTVAMGIPRRSSDIDIFVITAPRRLWAVRLLLHGIFSLGSLARRGNAPTADRLCLSFLVTTNAMDLSPLAKQPTDPYLLAWTVSLVPVLNRNQTYEAFWEKNAAMASALPRACARRSAVARSLAPSFLALCLERLCFGPIGDRVESFARRVQRPRMLANRSSRLHTGGTDVVVSDDVLKFHEEDKREGIRTAFLSRAATYGV